MTVRYPDPVGPPWRLPWLRMILQWDGGILQAFWIELVLAVTLCALIVTAVYFVYRDEYFENGVPEVLDTLSRVVSFIGRRFQAAIGMMLGFYMVTNFGRWNEVRNLEADAIQNINNAATQVTWRIRRRKQKSNSSNDASNPDANASADDDKDANQIECAGDGLRESAASVDPNSPNNDVMADVYSARVQLVRWLNLSHAIVVGEVYEGKPNNFYPLDKLVSTGLVKDIELSFLKEQNSRWKYVAPLVWFGDFMAELRDNEIFGVDDACINQVAPHILNIRNSLERLYRARDEPIPLVYKQLVNITVRFYLLILLIDAVLFEISRVGLDTEASLNRGSFTVILVYTFEYFLFVGWLMVADIVGNPFRRWADELEWNDYVTRTNVSSFLFSSDFGELSMPKPKIVEADDDVVEWRANCINLEKETYRYATPGDSGDAQKKKGFLPRTVFTGFHMAGTTSFSDSFSTSKSK